jgi:hypothetical protein
MESPMSILTDPRPTSTPPARVRAAPAPLTSARGIIPAESADFIEDSERFEYAGRESVKPRAEERDPSAIA